MEYFKVIGERYSSRSYRSKAVEKEKLDAVLEAARIAPTAANRQPFRVAVIDTEKNKEALKRIYSKDWFVQAPLVLCVIAFHDRSWVRADGKNYSEVDVGIVADHMILAAAASGLGTCWIGNFNLDEAKKFLKLGGDSEPVIFTPLGYPEDTAGKKTRKPMEDLVVYM
jgi:nitroreductase